MAPNVVTLSGFGFIVINVLTVLYLNPSLDKEQPPWAYFSYAAGLFLYQTFDACDGTHARRTGQSGPLGELFDHCIDSLNTTLSMFVFCSVIGSGYHFLMILCQFSLLCNFYLSTWEEYHTHKLFLSEFSGPVEGILLIIMSFIATGIFGPAKIWHTKIFEINVFSENTFVVESLHVIFFFSAIGLIFNIASARRNVITHYEKETTSDLDCKSKVRSADFQLLPFFVYFSLIFVLTFSQSKFIALPFIFQVGLSMAFTVGRIIIAHLTKQSYPVINPPLFIPLFQLSAYLILSKVLGHDVDVVVNSLNWLSFGLAIGIHAMFITEVIYEFTTYLDIYALSIKHPKKE